MQRNLEDESNFEVTGKKSKDSYMYEICLAKFSQNPDLKRKLLKTGDEELVEGNKWNDTYWGVCNGRGKNKLGKILMQVREELKKKFKRINF